MIMKLSKYFNYIEIEKDVYAVYNRLIFYPIYLTKKELNFLKKGILDIFSKSDISKLKKFGILIDDEIKDEEALNYLKEYVYNEINNKISLIYIIGNNNCNLGCKYCFIGKLNNEKPQKMPEKTLYITLDKFQKHLDESNIKKGTLVFYGAEPLINFELIKCAAKYIKKNKYRIRISIVSNVTLLTESIAKFIKNNNIGLGVSIDGPKNINDKNRVFYDSEKGTYNIVMNKIEMLKNLKVPFGLSVTINEDILKQQDKYLNWLESLEIEEITYNLMHYNNKDSNWEEYYNEIANFLFKSYKRLGNKINEGRINRKIDAFYKREFKYSDCGAVGGNQFCVKPNGDIVICHGMWNSNDKIGNILNMEIDDIFKTKTYKIWNNCLTLNNKKCLKCPFIYMCGGGCLMESINMFNSHKKIDLPYCIYTKEISKLILKEFYNNNIS